jgi:LysR family transcriptional regulator of gallate degradation
MSGLNSSLNLRRIRAFIAVAEFKSVSEAARRLNMTPPAISKSLRELEHSLDATLLNRTQKGMFLTAAGEAFFVRAKLALSELEQGAEEIAVLKGGTDQRIVVGALPNGSQPIVPLAVANVLKKRPSMRVSIRGGSYDTLEMAVRAGDMEFFVGGLREGVEREGLVTEILFYDELAIIARPDHPLAKRKRISVNSLPAQRWLLPDLESGLRERVESAFDRAGLKRPRDWLEVTPLGAMRALLRETDYLGVTTRMRVRDELDLGLLTELPVRLAGLAEPIAIVHRPTASMTQGGVLLLEEIRRTAAAFAHQTHHI